MHEANVIGDRKLIGIHGSMKKIGFCKQCLRNVPHVLFFQWPVFRLLNRNMEFANSLPYASWHCCGCEKNVYRLKRPDPEVDTDVSSTPMDDIVDWPDRDDPSQRFGLLFRRKRKTKVLEPSAAQAEAESARASQPEFEHVGNVTRSDDSLLVRKARAARYSKKYRESVVERIMSGKSTISQVRKELGLSERDLLDWLNDRMIKQDQQIVKLTQVVEAVKSLTNDSSILNPANDKVHPRLHLDASDFEPTDQTPRRSGATIEGQINRGG